MSTLLVEELKSLLTLFQEKLPVKDIENIFILIEAHEWGLAFEDLCTQLHEHDARMSPSVYNRIRTIGSRMNITSNAWNFLEELVTSDELLCISHIPASVWKSIERPWFFEIISSHTKLTDYILSIVAAEGKLTAITLRGSKMLTISSLFNEFSAALQFPYYFGENWGAFDECLNDLDWLSGDAFILVIMDAEKTLTEGHPEQFKTLLDILQNTCSEWNGSVHDFPDPFRKFKPFHIVFHTLPENEYLLDTKLSAISRSLLKALI